MKNMTHEFMTFKLHSVRKINGSLIRSIYYTSMNIWKSIELTLKYLIKKRNKYNINRIISLEIDSYNV